MREKGRERSRHVVMIVEDDPIVREYICDMFSNIPVDTLECESAELALATLLLRGPEIVLVISDVTLVGVMDGIDMAREAKVRWPHLTFVLTSGTPKKPVSSFRREPCSCRSLGRRSKCAR
jgi:CheY-like chemotaxis protein